MQNWFLCFAFFIGCCLGSFLCACAVRLQNDASLLAPRSRCDACGHTLAPWELVPLVSFLLLKGKCRHCGAKISREYFFRELETGFFFALLAAFQGPTVLVLLQWGILSLLLLLSWLDAKEQMIYEDLFWPLGLLILAQHLWLHASLWWAAAGAAATGGVLYFFYKLVPGSTGVGDVRLTALLGLWLGPVNGLKGLFGAVLAALFYLLLKRMKRKEAFWEPIPFAPFLCGAAFFVLLWDCGLQEILWPLFQLKNRDMLFCLLGLRREKIQNAVTSFYRPLPKKLLAVYFDKKQITLCQIRRQREKLYLERFLQEKFSDAEKENLSAFCERLRLLCSKKGITARDCALTLPIGTAAWAELALPPLKEKERQEAAYWESLQKIPWDAGTFSLRLGKNTPDGRTGALALPQSLLQQAETFCREMGWRPVSLRPAVISLGFWTAGENFAWLMLDGPQKIHLALYKNGAPQTVRSFSRPESRTWDGVERSELWNPEEAGETALLHQVGETIRKENKNRKLENTPTYWWGENLNSLENWIEFFETEKISLNPLPIAEKIEIAPCYPELDQQLETGHFAAALGSALLLEKARNWNFLPAKSWPAWPSVLRAMEVTGAAALAIFLFCGIFSGVSYKKRQNTYESLLKTGKWRDLYQNEQKINRLLARQEKRQQAVQRRSFSWEYWFTLLGKELPPDCYLETAAWDKGNGKQKVLRLSGKTLDSRSLLSFMERLKKEKNIKSVQMEKMEADGEKKTAEFSLLVELEKGNAHGTETMDGSPRG